MRLSVSISERLGKTVRNVAENEKKSVSSLTAEALLFYLQEKKKKNSVINCWHWQASQK
jgi:metal-responsive CopG/Arc/MetJ family transcriptional regulator